MRPIYLSLLISFLLWSAADLSAQVRSDETVVFFPTVAHQDEQGQWQVPIHGWIFEAEQGNRLRAATIQRLQALLNAETPEELVRSEARLRPFLVDSERGKRIKVELAGETRTLPPSARNGHFQGQFPVSSRRVGDSPAIRFRVVLPLGDERKFEGYSLTIPANGISVISDLDDTVRDSRVLEPLRLLRGSFVEPLKPVSGMAEAYQRWQKKQYDVHYVSAAPWQLHATLTEFLRENQFPRGSLHLQEFDWKSPDQLTGLFQPAGSKTAAIEKLLTRFPARQFILVGDTGQEDPQIYGALARRFPNQIRQIWLRDLGNVTREEIAEAMAGVQTSWRLFENGADLE